MHYAMASRGVNFVPRQYSSPYFSIFFIVFTIVGSFFISNLFVGVVVSTYNREKEKLGSHFLLTSG